MKSRTHDVGIYRPRHRWTFSPARVSSRSRPLELTPSRCHAHTSRCRRSGRTRCARPGKTVVFTNGVFDLLHPGHVRYLQHARGLGDALIVGLNSDRSVRQIKGPDRPITPEPERAEVLAALALRRRASSSSTRTRRSDLIAALQPDVLVKGADWAADAIVGRDIVEARGGRVVRVRGRAGPFDHGIIARVRRPHG